MISAQVLPAAPKNAGKSISIIVVNELTNPLLFPPTYTKAKVLTMGYFTGQ